MLYLILDFGTNVLIDTSMTPLNCPGDHSAVGEKQRRITELLTYECWNQRFQAIENLLTAIMSPGIKH